MKQKWLIFMLLPVFYSCLESPDMTTGIVNGKEKPSVITILANPHNTDGRLIFHGEIISTGKAGITERGFYWSTVSNDPGIGDNIILSNVNNDSFTCEMKDIPGNKAYYWRAFAKNTYGYDFGEVYSFKTPQIWEAKESLNAISRGRSAVAVHNNKIYIICGEYDSGGIPIKDVWEYDILSNNWLQLAFFPGDSRRYPIAFAIENKIYAGTGQMAHGVAFSDFYQYDHTVREWSKIVTPNDFEARYGAVSFSLNSKGYIVGGRSANNEDLNDVWQYNPENNSWEKNNDFPIYMYGGISMNDNNRAFVGFSSESELPRTLWEYKADTDTWSEFITLPDEVGRIIYSGVIFHNTMYVVDEKNTIWTYDMNDVTKIWKYKNILPVELLKNDGSGGEQKLLTSGNSIFVGLGFTKQLYEYRPLWDN